MRGLTAEERSILSESTGPVDEPGAAQIADDDGRARMSALVACGRLILRDMEDEQWEWKEWFTTDLGRLALRVCPVEE